MQILGTFYNVEAIWIHEEACDDGETREIVIESMRDFERLEVMKKEAVSNQVRIDGSSAINFDNLPIENTAWFSGGMTLYFSEEVNIAIVDSEEFLKTPFDSDDDGSIPQILVTDLDSVTPPLHTDS